MIPGTSMDKMSDTTHTEPKVNVLFKMAETRSARSEAFFFFLSFFIAADFIFRRDFIVPFPGNSKVDEGRVPSGVPSFCFGLLAALSELTITEVSIESDMVMVMFGQ